MNRIKFDCFPGGVRRCLTVSYDDGRSQDERLIEIFNENGIRGTFHLNSPGMNEVYDYVRNAEYIKPERIRTLYKGHEVSCHTATHPFPCDMPDAMLTAEISENRDFLEKACGYVVRGMSYPFGMYDDRTIAVYRSAGMEYSRTASETMGFNTPNDFMKWNPTCHHSLAGREMCDRFLADEQFVRMKLFYVWGHSYEFDEYGGWDKIEEFAKYMGRRDNVWYATNIEIVDYMNALTALRISKSCDLVYNPSPLTLWFSVNDGIVSVEPLRTLELK